MTHRYAFASDPDPMAVIPVRASFDVRFSRAAERAMTIATMQETYEGLPKSLCAVLDIMTDGKWRTASQVATALKWRCDTAQRRINYIPSRAGKQFRLIKKRLPNAIMAYRVVPKKRRAK